MGLTPPEEAKYALAYNVKRSDLGPAAQAEYDRLLPAHQARLEESARRAQEREKRAAATIWMPNLGVAIYDGNVYQHGTSQGGPASDRRAWGERRERMETKLLGPLAGAQAGIVSGRVGNRRSGGARVADATLAAHALGPVGLLAGAYSRPRMGGLAVVTFPGGGMWQKVIPDPASLMRAQAEALRFNALAAASQPAGGSAAWQVPSDDPVNYYPVTAPGSGQLHLIYGDMPDAPTLCGKSGAQDVPQVLSIDDVTCKVCRTVAGDFGGPPKSPFILTGRCPKCSRPVVWYKQRDKTPVHTATGKFECPADADSEEGTPVAAEVAAEPDSQEGTGVAAELERLAALHSSGDLDDEEFRAAKARIIRSG